MQESFKNEYFVDGFFIKHFGIWPPGVDKDNLFDEQKIFVIYLIGIIPSIDDWSINVNYQKELKKINEIKNIELSKTDNDLFKIQGKSSAEIEKIKQERLALHKRELVDKLNERFGIKENKPIERLEKKDEVKPGDVWNLLHGKLNGLQDKI